MDLQQRKRWNENHKHLTSILTKAAEHEEAVKLFLNQHALLHSSNISQSKSETLEDVLLQNLLEEPFRRYPAVTPDTRNSIAWHLWHIARIEDMTMNVLIGNREQIFHTGDWASKLGTRFMHTGNEMTEEEVAELSRSIDIPALLAYRRAVGLATREVIGAVQPGQFNRKVETDRIRLLRDQGAVKEEATWLLDYWGKKTWAGLVLMPATRHNFVHLNKAIRIKQRKSQTSLDVEVL
ncbi:MULTISPECIES: DinB family protein [Paenibacillus]|uniref:DinB family protein n=1 Tax=Paenibacillus TaxID=44249 RepID=UPI002FE0BB5C